MENDHITAELPTEPKSHLGFYLEHGISPVSQDISNLSTHLERRSSLYRYLGLPSGYFAGKKVLEVGPASGHNSLYVASRNPDEFDLLEPNPVAVDEIRNLYRNFDVLHTTPNVIMETLEQFFTVKTYDVVICEAWLGISDNERKLMTKLAALVKEGGILITTVSSPVGYFFNMVRRLLSGQFLTRTNDFLRNTTDLLSAFGPHLETLKDMTCPHIDWVQDSLLNPGFLTMPPSPAMFFEDVGKDYRIYNSYPRLSSDWRWYKSLHGEEGLFNSVFLEDFSENIHNLLDYRFVFDTRSSTLNGELENLCLEFRNFVTMMEEDKQRLLSLML